MIGLGASKRRERESLGILGLSRFGLFLASRLGRGSGTTGRWRGPKH